MKMRCTVLVTAWLLLASTWNSATATDGAPAVDAPPSSDDEALMAQVATLNSSTFGKTLGDLVRDLKTPEQRRAACRYILAVVQGDVGVFMSLVPEKGLVIEKTETKTKEKISWVGTQRRALTKGQNGRPRLCDVLNEVADEETRSHLWHVESVRGRLVIGANGAFAWATLAKASDGRFMIERITISFNND